MKKSLLSLTVTLALPLHAYDLHEWGTFTTVSGSDGKLLTGLHVEEENLPSFVYSHLGMEPGSLRHSNHSYYYSGVNPDAADSRQIEIVKDTRGSGLYDISGRSASTLGGFGAKGMSRGAGISNVTVKMETPVIYFYNGAGEKINVKVGFEGGSISQWFPDRLRGDTPNKLNISEDQMSERLKKIVKEGEGYTLVDDKVRDFSKEYKGYIEWDVELLEADDAYTFKHTQNPSWIYPKVSDANMVKVGKEYEDYLFYRGIGNFELPVTFSVNQEEVVNIKNESSESIPFAFAFEKTGATVRYKVLDTITDEVEIEESTWVTAAKNWQPEVFSNMRDGLLEQGLTRDEADGMVKTWWKSYFEQDGLRVFWVVPPKALEKILPLEVNPKPEKSVRVIVGRADILRPSFEQKMVEAIGKRSYLNFSSDRFHAAYENRLEALIKEPVFQMISEDELSVGSVQMTAINGESTLGRSVYLSKGREVEDQHFGKMGEWKVIDQENVMIGELHFKLDKELGKLIAKVDKVKNPESKWERYEISLRRYLN